MPLDASSRIKLVVFIFLSIFLINLLIFMFIENLDFITAVYFLIITITTVGFGDVTPHNPITQLSIVLLIIISILSLGYISEYVLNNLLSSKSLDLPLKPLDAKNHIVISPFNHLGQSLSRLAYERFLQPVIIDTDTDRITLARMFGLTAYKADIRQTEVLEKLNLEHALALFLLMEDDNDIIQTSILSKTFYHDLPVFAQVSLQTADEIDSHYMGITKSFHYEEIVAYVLQFYFNKFKYYVYDHQKEPDSVLKFIEVSGDVNIKKEFPDAFVIGEIDNKLRTLEPIKELTCEFASNSDNHVLIGIPREVYETYSGFKNLQIQYQHEKIVFGGFPQFTKNIMPLLTFPKEKILIITFSLQENELAKNSGYESIFIQKKDVLNGIKTHINSKDIIINTFDQIADSLLLIHTIHHIKDINPRIIQIVHRGFEIRVFRNTGIYRIIMPDAFVSRSMLIPLIRLRQMTTTFIFSFAHVFEHKVSKNDWFEGKNLSKLIKRGVSILLFRSRGESNFTKEFGNKRKLQTDDYIVVAIRPPQGIIEKTNQIRNQINRKI